MTPSLPVKSVGEFIAYAKAHPGELNYASYGAGSGPHLAAGLLQDITGTTMQHVPYGGGSPATLAVLRGEVQVLLAGSLAVGPQIAERRRQAARHRRRDAHAAPARTSRPSANRASTIVTGTWFGLLAPAKTPPDDHRAAQPRRARRADGATRCARALPNKARMWSAAAPTISRIPQG